MKNTQSAGPIHDAFVSWVKDRGVVIRGISPAQIPGHGLGMVATSSIKAGTEIVNVPNKALLTTDCIPDAFAAKFLGNTTVHGLLASYLAHGAVSGSNTAYGPWMATWPTYKDFQTYMPLLWPPELFQPLPLSSSPSGLSQAWAVPCSIGGTQAQWDYTSKPSRKVVSESLVTKQRRKLSADFSAARAVFPELDERAFTHKWLLVNTRSFYWGYPLRLTPRNNEDKMILCPFVDYFNHSDVGCVVQYDSDGYTATADRDYEAGEELFVCYGAHNNDLLLAEYGFIPASNQYDGLSLDAFVLAPETGIEERHNRRLKRAKYLDDYSIVKADADVDACHRTQVAVRAVTMSSKEWQDFVKLGWSTEELDGKARAFLESKVLGPFINLARASLLYLEDDDSGLWKEEWWIKESVDWEQRRAHIKDTLRLRWRQILELLTTAKESEPEDEPDS